MAGNSFGTLFRFTSWGESHGPAIGCVVDGTPPRIPLSEADIQVWMDKRRPGQSRFVTQRQEPDTVKILSGVFEGVTTGTPIALHIDNVDQRSRDYGEIKDQFRPSHADYTYFKKYGVRDYRGGGRQSARETAVRVAAGAIARKILGDAVSIRGAVVQLGTPEDRPRQMGLGRHRRQSLLVPRPPGGAGLGRLSRRRAQARQLVRRGDRGRGLRRRRSGLGDPVYDKLDADLAKALMSINAVKGVEIGDGFATAAMSGEENADEMRMKDGAPTFLSNHAGGILGGISTGQDIVCRLVGEADQLDPRAGAQHRPLRQRGRTAHQGPPRSLRRHPRHAGRRGDDGLRAGRPSAAPPRAVRLRPRRWPPKPVEARYGRCTISAWPSSRPA